MTAEARTNEMSDCHKYEPNGPNKDRQVIDGGAPEKPREKSGTTARENDVGMAER